MAKFQTRYDFQRRPGVQFTGKSRTKQSFKDECDVNNILKKYKESGIPPREMGPGAFGDFSNVTDFQSALNAVAEAQETFASLPAHVRDFFGNDAVRFVSFSEDPKNVDKMVELGLAIKRNGEANKPVIEDSGTAVPSSRSKKVDPRPKGEDEQA